ncbi:MAG: hypothetical protein ABUL71_02485, partial [Gemmatimonadota bacterium]
MRLHQLAIAIACSAGLLAAPSLAAQEPADRPFVDSLLADLGRAKSATTVPSIDRCAGRYTQLRLLCDALLSLRRNDFVTNTGDIARARDLLERLVEERPKWSISWYGLGLVRLRLVRAGMLSREGPLAPIGV